jgi:branched-chain amino acid transport system ATP-binding protein
MPDPFLAGEALTVRFGGVTAVAGVDLDCALGEIVGLIGPNGAGKSSLLGALLGTVTAGGTVRIDGADASRWPAHRRARAGLARTFQQAEVFGSMTVAEHLAYCAEAPELAARPWRLLGRGASTATVVTEVLGRVGLTEVAQVEVHELPVGIRRLVELGSALCSGPRLLLLDEPSSGLGDADTARFAEVVRDATRADGLGVVLVEHDMALVRALCDRVVVLDFGAVVATGTMDEVAADPHVRAAYLGQHA